MTDMHAHLLVHLPFLPVTRTPGWHADAARKAAATPPIIIARCAGGHAGGASEAGINIVTAALRGQLLPAHRVSHADSRNHRERWSRTSSCAQQGLLMGQLHSSVGHHQRPCALRSKDLGLFQCIWCGAIKIWCMHAMWCE